MFFIFSKFYPWVRPIQTGENSNLNSHHHRFAFSKICKKLFQPFWKTKSHFFVCPSILMTLFLSVPLSMHPWCCPSCLGDHGEKFATASWQREAKATLLQWTTTQQHAEGAADSQSNPNCFKNGHKVHFRLIVTLVNLSEMFLTMEHLFCLPWHSNLTLHCCFQQALMQGGGSAVPVAAVSFSSATHSDKERSQVGSLRLKKRAHLFQSFWREKGWEPVFQVFASCLSCFDLFKVFNWLGLALDNWLHANIQSKDALTFGKWVPFRCCCCKMSSFLCQVSRGKCFICTCSTIEQVRPDTRTWTTSSKMRHKGLNKESTTCTRGKTVGRLQAQVSKFRPLPLFCQQSSAFSSSEQCFLNQPLLLALQCICLVHFARGLTCPECSITAKGKCSACALFGVDRFQAQVATCGTFVPGYFAKWGRQLWNKQQPHKNLQLSRSQHAPHCWMNQMLHFGTMMQPSLALSLGLSALNDAKQLMEFMIASLQWGYQLHLWQMLCSCLFMLISAPEWF